MPDPSSLATGAATGGISTAVEAGLGAISTITGGIKEIRANNRLKRLRQRQTNYSTPQEYFDMQAMALNSAQTGYGAESMAYLTNQNDRVLSSSLDAITRLGGNPNNVADIFDRASQNVMKTAYDNDMLQYNKLTKVFETTQALADQRVAEWADKEAKLKDEMASEAQKAAAGNKTKNTGLNLLTSAAANYDAENLYKTGQRNALTSPTSYNGVPQETIAPLPSYMQNGRSTFGSTAIPRKPIAGIDYYNGQGELPSWMKNINFYQ